MSIDILDSLFVNCNFVYWQAWRPAVALDVQCCQETFSTEDLRDSWFRTQYLPNVFQRSPFFVCVHPFYPERLVMNYNSVVMNHSSTFYLRHIGCVKIYWNTLVKYSLRNAFRLFKGWKHISISKICEERRLCYQNRRVNFFENGIFTPFTTVVFLWNWMAILYYERYTRLYLKAVFYGVLKKWSVLWTISTLSVDRRDGTDARVRF